MTADPCQFLKAVVFDWAGTMIDHGSRAPARVFQEIFRRSGMEISIAQAREPMGMAKRDHIAAILAMPDVAQQWESQNGRPWTDDDVDVLYKRFLPLQLETLTAGSEVIDSVPQTLADCRAMGLKIGSSTGYTQELMEVVTRAAGPQGCTPDCVLCADDAPRGRPAPFLLYEAAKRLDVWPMWAIVKVDDTPVGIAAGRNAGCWTVGVTRTGNGVGLSAAEFAALDPQDRRDRCAAAETSLRAAGAHAIIESVAELIPVIRDFDQRAAAGELPI